MLHYNPQYVSSSTLLIFRKTNCIITASGTLSVNSRTVCRLRAALNQHTLRLFTERDDTRGCNNTICSPEDEQGTARNMSKIIM